MKITKKQKKYCRLVAFTLALALAAPFISCGGGDGGPGDPPATPQNFKAAASDGQVTLTWDPVDGEGLTYDLFYSETRGFGLENGTKISDVTSPYVHQMGLTEGTTYYYRLTANNSAGASSPTDEISATIPASVPPPGTPQGFGAVPSDRQVTLTWDSQAGVTYELLFSTSTGFTVDNPEGSFPGVTSPYTHKDLANDTTYYYLLRASNPSGTSMPTPEVSATTLFVKPENFTAVASNEQVTLTWGIQSDITYDLYHSTAREFSLQSGIKESNVMPPYPHTNLTNGIRIYYRLVANRNSPSDMMNMSAPAEGAATPYTAQADPAGRLSAARYHTCALMDEGLMDEVMNRDRRVKCWGDLREGQLGNGLRGIALRPIYAGNLTASVTQVSAGETHTCAVVSDGALCWGVGENGQLGDAMKRRRTTPVRVDKLSTGVTQISAGTAHTCAVVDGGALCWGKNNRGQLGNGSNIRRATPQQVTGLTENVTQISAGTQHTCALEGSGGAFCWGEGYGNTPQRVMGLTEGVTQISAGFDHTCAVVSGGAFCWGKNDRGQLGDGSNIRRATPQQVTGFTENVTQISAGAAHTCAVMNGGAFCWGWGTRGQLGNSGGSNANTPQQVMGLTEGVAQISAGTSHTCALVSGRFMCWGSASDGRLGNNAKGGGSAVPVLVQN